MQRLFQHLVKRQSKFFIIGATPDCRGAERSGEMEPRKAGTRSFSRLRALRFLMELTSLKKNEKMCLFTSL